MTIRYVPDTDTLTIELADRVSSSSEAVSDNLIVDIHAWGKPVGVTLEHDSPIAGTSTTLTLLPITPALRRATTPRARDRQAVQAAPPDSR